MIDDPRSASIYSLVVWIPMVDSDERSYATSMSKTFSDKPIPQFWDGEHRLGKAIALSMGITGDYIAWDIYLFYPPGAEWTDAGPPPPSKMVTLSMGGVIGLKGTLPPEGDQTRVPKHYVGKADVVGKPTDLAVLLGKIRDQI